MKIEAWWFENKQDMSEVLQPELLIPQSCCGVYTELEAVIYPFAVVITAKNDQTVIYSRKFCIEHQNESSDRCEITCTENTLTLKAVTENMTYLPTEINVEIVMGEKNYAETVKCEYARLHGKITDFDGKPFPAAVICQRIGFDKNITIGVWSDKNGEYSITVPKGRYNSFWTDDESYGKTSLENWCWNMYIDSDEKLDLKVGNGEVYSLSVWCLNGGGKNLFFYFRPMMLSKRSEYNTEINGSLKTVTDISPELELEDITVMLCGKILKLISLQKIYETTENYVMPAYIIQTERPTNVTGKQTALVEYNTEKRSSELGYTAQSQGRVQFYFKDANGLTLM